MTPEQAKQSLGAVIRSGLVDCQLKRLCYQALNCPAYQLAPASKDKHHAYAGGLLVHTWEVLERATAMTFGTGAIVPVLVVAAIWHDFGKIHEYVGEGFEESPYKSQIYHVAGSYGEFLAAARGLPVEEMTIQGIGHCILAHHGRSEWGSPVEPRTEEAYILHWADMWSSRFGPGRLVGKGLSGVLSQRKIL